MARKVLNGLDFTSTVCELPRKADPGTPVVGEMWVNAGALKFRDNGATPTTHVVEVQDNRNVASGYAGLTAGGQVAIAQGGTNSGTALSGSTIMVSNGSAIVQGPAGTTSTLLHGNAGGAPTYAAVALASEVSGVLAVANGGTNSGTALSGSSIMVSNGSAIVQGSAGTTSTVLHGNAAGLPTYSAVSLTADVSGILPTGNGGTNLSTYTVGDTLYASATNVLSVLTGNSTATAKVLQMVSGVPSWVIAAGLNVFTGASASIAGSTGAVPAPAAGQNNSFLTGASVWRTLLATTTTNDIPTTLLFSAVAAPSSPVEGNFWNDSTQKCLTAYIDNVKQYDSRVLFIQTANGVAQNSTAELTLFSTGIGTLTLPANFLTVGKTLRIRMYGTIARAAAMNLTFKTKLGSNILTNSGAIASLTTTVAPIWGEAIITCRSIGTGGTVIAQSNWQYATNGGSSSATYAGAGVSTTTAINTTASQVINVTIQMSAANAGNIFTITNATVEVIG